MNLPLSLPPGLRALALAAAIVLAPVSGHAQTSPITTFLVPVSQWAIVTSGEQVLFQGQAAVETQLVKDPLTTVDVLLINVSWAGVVGTAYPSLTKYVLTGREMVMRPNAALQSMEISFPMQPQPGSAIAATRVGVAAFSFWVNTTTGAITGIASGTLTVK